MNKPLDMYDDMPHGMRRYLSNYGWHFNKKAFEVATGGMKKKNPTNGKEEKVDALSKEQVEALLARYNVKVENGKLYDAAYVMMMGKADYLRSSIPDDQHLAMYVKDVIDDVDGCDELPFRFWLQKCVAMGEPIEWEDLV